MPVPQGCQFFVYECTTTYGFKRTLAEAFEGADVFMGLSAKGAVTKDMVKTMAKNPMIFPMANPDPEITPEDVRAVRSDAIIATGRSDYPNQINNVLGFPYIFRGALDVRARTINEEMKVAAAKARCGVALIRRDWRSWHARMCPTKSRPPMPDHGRPSDRTTSSLPRSIRA